MSKTTRPTHHHECVEDRMCPVYEMDMFDSFWSQVRLRYNGYHTTERANKRHCLKCHRLFQPKLREHFCSQCARDGRKEARATKAGQNFLRNC